LPDFTEFCFSDVRGNHNLLFLEHLSYLGDFKTTFKRVVENDVTSMIARFYRVLF